MKKRPNDASNRNDGNAHDGRMKVEVVGTRGFPNVQGGVEKHCENLYTHLTEKGCAVTVFTRRPYTFSDVRTYKGVTLIPVDCPQNKYLEAIYHTFKCVFKAWKLRGELLHIHAIGPALFTPMAKALGMKVVVTTHGPDYQRVKWSLPAKVFLKFCERMGMMFADEIIAIARNIADDIKSKYGRNAVVIPNGVVIPCLAETEVILARHNLEKGKYILSVGRLVPEKGFHDLMDAFLSGGFDDYKLVIAGDADHEDTYSIDLKRRADRLDNIVFTGFLTEQPLKELYTHAALFVLPSYYEGLPIALLEAMSYGLPCIASDIPANRNVQLGEAGFFKAGDIKSISEKIREVMSGTWSEEDKTRQRNMIHEFYNWDRIAEETLHVYKKIVSKNPPVR